MPMPLENIKIPEFGSEYEIECLIELKSTKYGPDGVDFEAEMDISHLKRTFAHVLVVVHLLHLKFDTNVDSDKSKSSSHSCIKLIELTI